MGFKNIITWLIVFLDFKQYSMKTVFFTLFVAVFSFNATASSPSPVYNDSTDVQKIAARAGYDSWQQAARIKFSFNVVKNGQQLRSRGWEWDKTTDQITLTSKDLNLQYYRNTAMDSITLQADASFVNDSYWLLVPFKLVTDMGTSITYTTTSVAPISKQNLHMLTITYGDTGGYTPGDAYDVYYDSNYHIKEWAYRRGNGTTAQLTTTFENYQTYNGITFATDHVFPDGVTSINFSDIQVLKNQ